MSLQPEPDSEFHRRLAEALRGDLRVYTALLPAASIIPFDPRFRLDADPDGMAAIHGCIAAWRRGEDHRLTVYPCGAWFVAGDDYAPLFAALHTRLEYIRCWVLGPAESAFAREWCGPVDGEEIRQLGCERWRRGLARRSPSLGCGTSGPCR